MLSNSSEVIALLCMPLPRTIIENMEGKTHRRLTIPDIELIEMAVLRKQTNGMT